MLIHERNISHFVVACETYHPKYIHFGTKIRSLTQRRKHYNTLKLEVLPRLQKRKLCFTLPSLFFFFCFSAKCRNFLMLVRQHSQFWIKRFDVGFYNTSIMNSHSLWRLTSMPVLCYARPVIFCDTYTAYLAADACPLNTFILSPGVRALIIP